MTRVIERGDIYFVYRPRIGDEEPEGVDDVQRLFAILSPHDKPVYRRIVVGRKRLPDIREHERSWAFVDRVARRPELHLTYALELPREPGDVQEDLGIEPEASYVVTVRNPDAPSAPRAGLPRRERPSYPARLQERFAGRRFAPLDPDFLDHEGAELILVGAREEPEPELGIELDAQSETAETADIFRDLHLSRESHPVRPLFEGAWD